MTGNRRRWTDGPYRPGDMNGVDRSRIIHVLVKDNPKRQKSRGRFDLYRPGITVGEYIAAVREIGQAEQRALDDLCWDLNQRFIRLEAIASDKNWSVAEAKAKLSEILRRARDGEPQTIGAEDPCVVVSASDFQKYWRPEHLGRFLVESAPRGCGLELPSRAGDRADPFAAEKDERAA